MNEKIRELKDEYKDIEDVIKSRINEFKEIWAKGDEEEIFEEMVFCLFTPQSKAKVCWNTVEKLKEKDMIQEGKESEIADEINEVRFRYNKAGYVVEARDKILEKEDFSLKDKLSSFSDSKEAREWIVENIKGLGYKEASHFLRNIGQGEDIAILDRHILRNLEELGVIDEIPKTLTKKRYMKIEEKMRDFADDIGIPLHHLDLVLWYRETGEVFK